ncbi:MAG: HAMP domain-containing sensor histidine kinase [Desulfobacterium sp.]
MKIRKKVTLWISGTVLLSTIVFSSFIFFELMEEPFKFIDNEMKHMTQSLVKLMKNPKQSNGLYDFSHMPYNPDLYWIKVTDNEGNSLYESELTQYAKILPNDNKTIYMVEKKIPRSLVWLDQDKKDDVLFRVMVIETQLHGQPVSVRIGKPIEDLEEELIELLQEIVFSLTLCTLVIIIVSYKLAGKILNPVVSITRMAKEISKNSLHKRIPLNGNKDELYALSLSLNRMFDRLQYSFKRQKEFVGNASHELKSPITRLMLAQEEMIMSDNLPSLTNKGLVRQLQTTRRMSHLVKNLLDLSRLEQQETVTKKSVNMTSLMDHVLEDYNELLASKTIRLEKKLEKDLFIQGDSEKLYRLFINLVDNSIKYNLEKDGVIIVEGKKTNRGIVLEISNTGHPIPEEDLELIFEQFYRVEKSRSTTHGGSGLGLAIAKKIVELHGGAIKISNEPGKLIKTKVFLI